LLPYYRQTGAENSTQVDNEKRKMSSRHQQSSITVLILFLFLLTIRINSSSETRGPVEDGIQTFFHVKDKPETGTKVVYEDQIIYPTENKFKQHSS
jgi:hypothetical protein